MKDDAAHVKFLARALELAARGEGHTRPNPPVGAVVVKGGRIVGEGWHKQAGGDHAEVAAIKDALSAGSSLRGARLYVTLEPCSKAGRVGACTDAIVAAGIKKVYYAVPDPNPKNRSRAKRVLAKQGVFCEGLAKVGALGDLIRAAQWMIEPFAKHVTTALPLVTVKLAMSLDGKICDDFGNAKWLTSARSRKLTGYERAKVDAIMVGAETIRKDNPSLLSHHRRNDDLIRVIVTRSGHLPKNAQVFTDGRNGTLVYKTRGSLRAVLLDLGKRGVMHVLCEGGLKLARALADEGLVDRWLQVTAPIVIGSRHLKDTSRFKVRAEGFLDVDAGDRFVEYHKELVAKAGIEPATHGFSVRCSTN